MREQLKIGDISLLFTYQFHEFFGSQLKQYHVRDLGDEYDRLAVYVQDDIKDVDGEHKLVKDNKVRFKKEDKTYIVTYYKDHSIKHLISYSNDYKNINIILNKNLNEKLAEFEYVLSGMMFFEIAISHHYLPIHASAIAIDDDAILLSGPSKSGKSTQTNYIREQFTNSQIINEDKPLLFENNQRIYVCGSPWSGKHVINKNIEKRLRYIFFVNKAKTSEVCSMSHADKLHHLMKNIHRPGDEENMHTTLNLAEKIVEKIGMFRFDCMDNKSSSFILKQFLEE